MEALVLLASHGFLHDGAWGVGKVESAVKKSFAIRLATPLDVDALTELDSKCWGELSLPRENIADRIERYKEGQWVAHVNGKIVGVMYTQRIPDRTTLESTVFQHQHELHTANGSTLQLLGVAVLPEFGALQVSQSLRDFVLRLACLNDNISQVVAMTRCSDESPDESSYFLNVSRADDPTLQFHVQGGAQVVKVVKGYRPEDRRNYGHAVLISYNLHKQSLLSHDHMQPSASAELDGIDNFSLSEIIAIVNELSGTQHSSDIEQRPFMELGLDSLKIMEFRARLLKLDRIDVSKVTQSLLFDFPTPRKLLNYLNGTNTALVTGGFTNIDSRARGSDREVLICGASCRFPAGANDPPTFLDMLRGGVPFLQPIPAKWKSSLGVQVAGFLDDNAAETFDPGFFHIGTKEAAQMDPHQRILLEVCYEALNDAGLLDIRESCSIGVFIGLCNNEWIANRPDDSVTAFTSVCTAQSAAANRVSFTLGLTGPSMVIDTACSSSLAAVHVAVQSLLAGDCDAAIVAAADLLISPYSLMIREASGMLTFSDGNKSFSADASGYVRSEGAAAVVLKASD
eukprot:gene36928-44801_t